MADEEKERPGSDEEVADAAAEDEATGASEDEESDGSEDEESGDAEDEESGDAEDEESGDAEDEESGDAEDEESDAAAESPWMIKARRAQELWDAGNNAELRKLVEELERAPESEQTAREVAAELRRRLKPDPIAIGLWLVTLAVFCFLSYWFVVR